MPSQSEGHRPNAGDRPEQTQALSRDQRELSADELAQQESSELPERDAMSLVNLNAAIPVNAAVAANVLSDGSTAEAAALQQTPINQGT